MTSSAHTPRDTIRNELARQIGHTIDLLHTGQPYPDVIRHLGKIPAHHRKALAQGDGCAGIIPKSSLFSEICFHLERENNQHVVAMEFFSNAGAFNMDDLRAVFGDWHRSPPEPEECTFAIAWFPKYDVSSGARFFLYAEDGTYGSAINPDDTPCRLFIQVQLARWGE